MAKIQRHSPARCFEYRAKIVKCKERQRYNAETDGRRETMERKKESGDGRRDGCDQEPFRPIVETFTSNHSKQNDEPGENWDQTDQRVNDRVRLQYHMVPLLFTLVVASWLHTRYMHPADS